MFIPIRPVALTKKFRLPDCPFGSLNLRIFSETDGCYFFNSCCGRRASLLWRYTYIYECVLPFGLEGSENGLVL